MVAVRPPNRTWRQHGRGSAPLVPGTAKFQTPTIPTAASPWLARASTFLHPSVIHSTSRPALPVGELVRHVGAAMDRAVAPRCGHLGGDPRLVVEHLAVRLGEFVSC